MPAVCIIRVVYCVSTLLISVNLPWIFPWASLAFNWATGNIQGNLTGMNSKMLSAWNWILQISLWPGHPVWKLENILTLYYRRRVATGIKIHYSFMCDKTQQNADGGHISRDGTCISSFRLNWHKNDLVADKGKKITVHGLILEIMQTTDTADNDDPWNRPWFMLLTKVWAMGTELKNGKDMREWGFYECLETKINTQLRVYNYLVIRVWSYIQLQRHLVIFDKIATKQQRNVRRKT